MPDIDIEVQTLQNSERIITLNRPVPGTDKYIKAYVVKDMVVIQQENNKITIPFSLLGLTTLSNIMQDIITELFLEELRINDKSA